METFILSWTRVVSCSLNEAKKHISKMEFRALGHTSSVVARLMSHGTCRGNPGSKVGRKKATSKQESWGIALHHGGKAIIF
jgi:hypothetical protein